ncbi:hypothetical protein AAEX28_01980 [Lentisphaerota bacterium WC36G]|nr:hypothetical protein LJT99_04865 [Lentisphaerae bacterium WC36]
MIQVYDNFEEAFSKLFFESEPSKFLRAIQRRIKLHKPEFDEFFKESEEEKKITRDMYLTEQLDTEFDRKRGSDFIADKEIYDFKEYTNLEQLIKENEAILIVRCDENEFSPLYNERRLALEWRNKEFDDDHFLFYLVHYITEKENFSKLYQEAIKRKMKTRYVISVKDQIKGKLFYVMENEKEISVFNNLNDAVRELFSHKNLEFERALEKEFKITKDEYYKLAKNRKEDF